MDVLHIAEVMYPSGSVRARYARYLSDDRTRWVRHGLYLEYHEGGTPKSEGAYEHGQEHGPWTDFHANGQPAARGRYELGNEVGVWNYWSEDGTPEAPQDFSNP